MTRYLWLLLLVIIRYIPLKFGPTMLPPPDLCLIYVIYIMHYYPSHRFLFYAIGLGIVSDIIGGGVVGITAINIATAWLILRLLKKVVLNCSWPIVWAVATIIIFTSMSTQVLLHHIIAGEAIFNSRMLLEALITSLCYPLLYLVLPRMRG